MKIFTRQKYLFIFSILFLFSQTIFAQPPVKQVNKGIVNGSASSLPKPIYPPAAMAVKASGEVKVQVIIDEAGTVVSAKVISGHPLLRQVSEQAAWQARFKPTLLSGNPVKVSGVIIYNFVPNNPQDVPAVNEEIWGVGMVFAMLEKADDEMLKQTGVEKDFADIISGLDKAFAGEMAQEKQLMDKLAASKGAERQKNAGELSKSLEKYLTENELEAYRTGVLFGTVMVETIRSALSLAANPNAKIETNNLKRDLIIFRDKLNSTMPLFTNQTAAGFKEVASFADVQDLGEAENLQKLFSSISKIMDAVFPEDEEEKKDTKEIPSTTLKEGNK